jgi:hypothetical protein
LKIEVLLALPYKRACAEVWIQHVRVPFESSLPD